MIPDSPQRRYHALSDMLSGVTLIPKDRKPSDCSGDFFEPVKPGAFCDRWTPEDLADTLAQTGCLAHWHRQGFAQIWIELENDIAPERHTLGVWTQVGDKSELLMHIVVWIEYVHIERLNMSFPAFSVEHLRLQTPSAPFLHPPLPGQNFASSGLLRRIFGIIKSWSAALGAEIITEIPEYFHTATLFSQYFSFIDIEMEALFRAMRRDLLPEVTPDGLARISHAFEQTRVRHNGKPVLWPTEMQGFALSHELAHKLMIPPETMDAGKFTMVEPLF